MIISQIGGVNEVEKIKIAQIGTSETTHSVHIMTELLKQKDVFEVVGVADVDNHLVPINPIFSKVPMLTVDEILNYPDLDAVLIECDEELITHYATLAAEKGFAIGMEKPGSASHTDFCKLIDIVKQKNLVFNAHYMYRYNPAVTYAMEKVKNGELGDIHCIEAQMNIWHNKGFRNRYGRFKGGIMFYLGCHMVDIVYRFLGTPDAIIPLSTNHGEENVNCTDLGLAVFKYKKGSSIVKVDAAEVGGAPFRRYIIICGSKGTIKIDPIEYPVGNGLDATKVKEIYLNSGNVTETTFAPYGRYAKMLSDFAAMVRGEKQNPYSYESEKELHRLIIEACGN